MLLAVGVVSEALRDLASEAAVALSLAPFYTDWIDTVRRTRPTSPAAEIQQNLLPPRYTENPRGTWIGIADSEGTGPSAAGIGAVPRSLPVGPAQLDRSRGQPAGDAPGPP